MALNVVNIESYQAFLFYIIQYLLTNLSAFMVLIGIGFSLYLYFTNTPENKNLQEKDNSPIQLISQVKGYFTVNPILALCLVTTMFSFVGLPPLIGFFGKQMVLATALDNHKTILVLIAIIASVIGAVYYLSVIRKIYFDESDYELSYAQLYSDISLTMTYTIILGALFLFTTLFIIMPTQFIALCNILSEICFSNNFLFMCYDVDDGQDQQEQDQSDNQPQQVQDQADNEPRESEEDEGGQSEEEEGGRYSQAQDRLNYIIEETESAGTFGQLSEEAQDIVKQNLKELKDSGVTGGDPAMDKYMMEGIPANTPNHVINQAADDQKAFLDEMDEDGAFDD